ncbi:MAG TPA: hypothetical protein VE422_04340 [Terriglobia bacterium]|nr:hypothetical protein [Terriglobia bacterium]
MFEWLRESTWGYPIIGAIHVLGMAWFGGTVLIADRELVAWKRVGFVLMILTGALLFGLHAGRYYTSVAFRIKMLLLIMTGLPLPRAVCMALWVVIIFASRAIAFL